MTDPKVSVFSLVYNHARYVKDMLDGFLMQKTDFEVEYIIHDDASTDGTQEILHDYEKKYPGKFKVIYENENQWSKGVKITQKLLIPRAKGQYFAFCEGDDYWIDRNKLQIQADFLDSHSDYVGICHNALLWDCEKDRLYPQNNCDMSKEMLARDVIPRRFPAVATASWMYRMDSIILPDDFLDCGSVGDVPTDFYAFSKGRVYYDDRIMSVYRYLSNGSWSKDTYKTLGTHISWRFTLAKFLLFYNQYTDQKYEYYIAEYLSRGFHDVLTMLLQGNISREELSKEIESVIDNSASSQRIILKKIATELLRLADLFVYGRDVSFISALQEYGKIYVFGTGLYGKQMVNTLRMHGIEICGFLVFDNRKEEKSVLNIPVIEASSFKAEKGSHVIIAVNAGLIQEVTDVLVKNNIKDFSYPLMADLSHM